MTPQGLAFFEAHKRELSNLHVVSQVADRVFHFVSNFRHAGDQTTQLRGIHTIIRDKECERSDFVFQSDRLIRMVVEEALSLLPTEPRSVTTPTGVSYDGLRFGSKLCAVSIPRSGDTMEQGVRQVIRDVRIGKILIQRDEHTAKPVLLYSKLPLDIANRIVLLLDPMLATGGSVVRAIEVLVKQGVPPRNIIFVNLFAVPEGIRNLSARFPEVRIVTSAIDDGLNAQNFIVPGIGDYGDRFYGTEELSKILKI